MTPPPPGARSMNPSQRALPMFLTRTPIRFVGGRVSPEGMLGSKMAAL